VDKKKRAVLGISIIILVVGGFISPIKANASHAQAAFSQYTQPDPYITDWYINQTIPESFQFAAENSTFQLYVEETSLAFKVVDKRSGYIWHSNLDERQEGDRLNRTWTAFASSGISIDYLDQKAVSNRNSITNSETTINMEFNDQGFRASVTFIEPSIALDVIVRLEDRGVSVEVPFESIKENDPAFKLGLLHVYPFFGATRGDSVPGYMFIPDGCGSLIRFSSTTRAQNMFYGRYYGPDLGMITTLPYDPTTRRPFYLSIPVSGMVHGYKQNAYIAIVEHGAAYGELRAHPTGIITNFNFLYNTFLYNESYFQATNRSGAGVTTLQPNTNAYDVLIHYRFLTGEESDYVGMARSYQQYLVEKGVLSPLTGFDQNIGIRLEFLGGEKERFLFWHRFISMTTVSQMADMIATMDISNPEVIYYGWQHLGAATMPPTSLRLDRRLGNLEDLTSLIDRIEAEGGNFSLYLDPQAALVNEGGYSMRYDLAMSITNNNLMGYNRNKVNYFLNYGALSDRYLRLSSDVFTDTEAGLAIDNLGYTLYSDFRAENLLNREDAITMYQTLLRENSVNTSLYTPNDYLFEFMRAYYDMPITNSGYIYTTDIVPFLQIVFAGYIPYYGTGLNFSSDIHSDLLRHIDFGVYPSFFLTQEVTARILNTSSSWIFTSSFEQWSQEIEQTYQWVNSILGPVRGQSIISRDVVSEGVVAVTYSNHMQVLVNYTNTPILIDEVVVNASDAVLREVAP
jgi:hypothetical protein